MKNVELQDNGAFLYNLGVRKPVLNAEELLSTPLWQERILGKWVYMKDEDRNRNIFIKHVFDGKRLSQVIYSGEDIYGDGVYILYILKLWDNGRDFYLDPVKYSLKYGSFDFVSFDDYLSKVLSEGYITSSEKHTLMDKKLAKEFSRRIYRMEERFVLPES